MDDIAITILFLKHSILEFELNEFKTHYQKSIGLICTPLTVDICFFIFI